MRLSRLLGVFALLVVAGIGLLVFTTFGSPETSTLASNAAQRGMTPFVNESNHGGVPGRQEGPVVSEVSVPSVSQPMRTLPRADRGDPTLEREVNPRQNLNTLLTGPVVLPLAVEDPLVETGVYGADTPTPTLVFEGISYAEAGDGFPPDTVGDVGPNHYVQAINVAFQVFDKTGASLAGPVDIRSLWSGQAGACASADDGDPIVVYDELADRWMIAQFFFSSPYGFCIAISQTPDPTGSYYLYQFNNSNSFPDYYKIGVWPNAYYIGANESSYTAFAIDRNAMLAGLPATQVKFTGETNFLMPADVDGATPPSATAPGIFYTFKDDNYHGGGGDRLEIFELAPDFVTPANSTFQLATTIPISDYTYTVCGFFTLSCIRQPATGTRIDAVSEWPMWRLAYRNMGTHETLVGNFAVGLPAQQSGIRWFELRKTGATPYSLYQEGTFAPDGDSRFMGSIAMDKDGNIGMGYNVSSTTTYPSLRHTVRLADDPPGTLRNEAVILNGTQSQSGVNRWGDYSAMSVDPLDGCTFWFTGEILPLSGGTTWTTYVASFKVPECGNVPTAVTLNSLDAANTTPLPWLALGMTVVVGFALAAVARKR